MEVGAVTFKYEADFSKVEQQMARAKTITESLTKNTQQLASATQNITKNSNEAANATAKLRQTQEQTVGTARNLQSTIRELTTGMLGNNIAAVALGTTLGNLALQTLSSLARGLIESVTQFGRLQNEMARTDSFAGNVGREFEFVTEQARLNGQTLQENSQQWTRLATQARDAGLGIETTRQFLIQYNAAQQLLQRPTLVTALNQTSTAFGGLVSRLDGTLGVSQGLVNLLEKMSTLFNSMTNLLPKPVSKLEELRMKLAGVNREIANAERGNFDQIVTLWGKTTITAADAVEKLNQFLAERNDLEEQLLVAGLAAEDPERLARRSVAQHEINTALEQEISLARMMRGEMEVQNRLFQVQQQFRDQAAGQVRAQFETQIRMAQAASQIQPIRESLRTPVQAEMEEFAQRMEALQTFYKGRQDLSAEYNSLLESEFFRSSVAMTQIARSQAEGLMQAQNRTFSSLANVLGTLGQKSKVAAAAALAVNTALSVRSAAQNTSVAATRALAELGPVAGPPMAASIEAWGAGEIAMILANGALSLGAAMKGGAIGGGGGGSSGDSGSGTTTVDDEPSFGRSVTINLEGGQLYSTEQVQKLMERMGEEVKQGATLISTRVL